MQYRFPKPTYDPLYHQVVEAMARDPRSKAKFARESGLSSTTLRNWENGVTRYPQAMSLQLAARAMGLKLVLTKA